MSQDNIIISDRDLLEMKTAAIQKAGLGKLQVIADFDGSQEQTSHRLLQQGNVEFNEKRQALFDYYHLSEYSSSIPIKEKIKLMEEFNEKRQTLFDYYHLSEYSSSIPIKEKIKLMEEWWKKIHGLLVEGGLAFDAIQKSMAGATIGFREGIVTQGYSDKIR